MYSMRNTPYRGQSYAFWAKQAKKNGQNFGISGKKRTFASQSAKRGISSAG